MQTQNFIRRSEKVNFMKVSEDNYSRMKFFTAMEEEKNPREYPRVYKDETFERVDVIGISSSVSFSMDERAGDAVHEIIVDIFDNERLGEDAVVEILSVNFSKPVTTGALVTEGSVGYEAKLRSFTLIPESEGGDEEAYSYSGSLRSRGQSVTGVAIFDDLGSAETLEDCTFAFTPQNA